MECREAQKRLTAYLEGTLPPEEKTLVEEHLAPCQQCSQSLAELKRTLEHLQGLTEVEPPPWLAQKVMARVRSEAEAKKGIWEILLGPIQIRPPREARPAAGAEARAKAERGIWEFLFHPIHIKLPLEAAGVIAIAVTTIYVFKAMQPAMQVSKELSEEARGPAISEMAKPPAGPESKAPPTIPEAARVRAPATMPERLMPRAELGAVKPEYEQAAPAPPPAETLSGAGTREESKPEALLAMPRAEESRKEAAKDELEWDRRPLSSAPRAKALAERAEKQELELHLTLAVNDIGAATREVEKTILGLGGKILQEQLQEDNTILVAELSSDQVETLFSRLKPLGALKGEVTEPEPKEGGTRIVRLEISISQ
jgi:hypothetical protein